jgi:RHS repeat-associated protein
VTDTFVYDAFGRLAAEYSTGPGDAPGRYFRTTDHLGSTRLVTNAAMVVVSRRDFFPFGEQILANTTSGRNGIAEYNAAIGFPQLFTGKERDGESGLDYFLARYYSGALGRFTSVDPENAGALGGDPQSWNGYAYVTNQPLALTDPDGRCPWCVGAIVGAITDVAIQVAVDGRSLDEIDLGSVAISAAAGAIGVGIATKLTKLDRVARVGLELGSDVVASGAQQLNETGEVSIGTTILDVSGGKIAGDVAGSFAQKSGSGSRGVQLLKKEADRKTRIANKAEARGNQSSANRRNRQAAAITQQADNIVARRTAAVSVSASQAGSKVVTQTAEEVKRRLEEDKKNR